MNSKGSEKLKVCVIGSGSWGTALATHLASCGHEVLLWGRDSAVLRTVNEQRENTKYLAGIPLAPGLKAEADLQGVLAQSEMVVCSIPTQQIRQVFSPHVRQLAGKIVVNTSKGMEMGTLARVSQIFAELSPTCRYAVLSGPSFAQEVAKKYPTAVTVAATDPAVAEKVQRAFSNAYFRAYSSIDVVGVEIAGSLKNVIAIASGVVAGLNLGYNAQAALINRGIAEMTRLGHAKGAKLLTFLGLAGMGDLILTCTGPLSRNRRFGEELGRGKSLPEIQKSLGGVAEGFYTAKSGYEYARAASVELPIAEQIYLILYEGRKPEKALTELMSRDLKEEWELAAE